MQENLEYRGGLFSLLGTTLLVTLLTLLTCGIYLPWGCCRLQRKAMENTYWGDHPLGFDGTGEELALIWLQNIGLSIITAGIYWMLCFAKTNVLEWETEHTVLPDGSSLRYRGEALDYFGEAFLVFVLSLITLGIYYPWGVCRLQRYVARKTLCHGEPLAFVGEGLPLLGIHLLNGVLSEVTSGIYDLTGCGAVLQLRWWARGTIMPFAPDAWPGEDPEAADMDGMRTRLLTDE